MILSFNNNIFVSDLRGRIDIETFQVDSENLVIARLNRDKYNTNNNIFGLQRALRKIWWKNRYIIESIDKLN